MPRPLRPLDTRPLHSQPSDLSSWGRQSLPCPSSPETPTHGREADVTHGSQPSPLFLWHSTLEKFPLNPQEVPQNHMKDDIWFLPNESTLSTEAKGGKTLPRHRREKPGAAGGGSASPAEMALALLLITATEVFTELLSVSS